MREYRLRKAVIAAAAPVGATLVAASMASAQTYQTFTNTFDNASSVVIGTANYNPAFPPSSDNANYASTGETFRYEGYKAVNPTVSWSNAEDDTPGTQISGGGSIKLQWKWFGASSGSGGVQYTSDLFPYNSGGYPLNGGATINYISFDLMVAPGSATDTYGGNGSFAMFTRNASYTFVNLDKTNGAHVYVNGISQDGGYKDNWEVGNPTYSDPDQGTWEAITITFTTPMSPVRALDFQDYNNGAISGTETMYIDNLNISYEVPEPASLGLLGLTAPALLMRRRNKVKA